MELVGKISLITGDSRGVGKAIAHHFAAHGCNIAIVYKSSKDEAQKIVSQIKKLGRNAIAISADLRDYEQAKSAVQQTIDKLGGLDILYPSAGARVQWNKIRDSDQEQWADYETNRVLGSFNIFKRVMRHRHKNNAGRLFAS